GRSVSDVGVEVMPDPPLAGTPQSRVRSELDPDQVQRPAYEGVEPGESAGVPLECVVGLPESERAGSTRRRQVPGAMADQTLPRGQCLVGALPPGRGCRCRGRQSEGEERNENGLPHGLTIIPRLSGLSQWPASFGSGREVSPDLVRELADPDRLLEVAIE